MIGRRGASLDELEALYRSRFDVFARVAASVTGDAERARDAVQEAFAVAVRKRGSFRSEGPLEAWVWRIVLNVARTDMRRSAGEIGHVDRARSNGRPEEHAELRAALAHLPERQRTAVFLRYYADLDYAAIGEALGIRTGTVAATLNAAHTALGVNSKIAFVHNTRTNCCPHELWIMNADGSEQRRLARRAAGITWSPDERQIAYFKGGSWRGGIYVVEADGSGRRLLAGWGVEPDWSPDGRRIVFVSRRDRNAEIYVMNADGSAQRNLTRDPGAELHPVWSPDGQQIAFLSRRDESNEIHVMNADGSDRRSLTRDVAAWSFPAWSPDGRKIAFVNDGEIYVMNSDGRDLRNLTRRNGFDGSPAWSPDGRRLVYVHQDRSARTAVHVMNADGSMQRRLDAPTPLEAAPAWSPDGRKIAYTSRDSTEVYVINPDGSGRQRLTHSPWANWFAGWSPGPRRGS